MCRPMPTRTVLRSVLFDGSTNHFLLPLTAEKIRYVIEGTRSASIVRSLFSADSGEEDMQVSSRESEG